MSLQKITLKPGINTEASKTLNEGGWSNGSLVRFRQGMPETEGGWVSLVGTALSGVPRAILAWTDLTQTINVAAGTSANLQVYQNGSIYDITPSDLSAGLVDPSTGLGVSAGPVGAGTVGTARSTSSITLPLRTWSLENWGDWLLAVARDGPLYRWAPEQGVTSPAIAISTAPLRIKTMIVGSPEDHVICLGCSDPGTQDNFDPMLVRWSDQGDPTVWSATTINTAGAQRLQGGSYIVDGLNATGAKLIWTDTHLHQMQFLGSAAISDVQIVYGFTVLGISCGLIAPNAKATANGVTYWMGHNQFFSYNGGAPSPMECTLWSKVFENINRSVVDKISCGLNSGFNEIVWFYPSSTSSENDSYVKYNYLENLWYLGSLQRNAWCDVSGISYPLGIDSLGNIFQHENGNSANGGYIDAFLTSGFFDLSDGTEYIFADRFIPDFGKSISGSLSMTLEITNYPNDTATLIGPYTITSTTEKITFRARARQMAMKLESSGTGNFWRMGAPRVNTAPDGRR